MMFYRSFEFQLQQGVPARVPVYNDPFSKLYLHELYRSSTTPIEHTSISIRVRVVCRVPEGSWSQWVRPWAQLHATFLFYEYQV